MKNIYHQPDYNEIVDRIKMLASTNHRLWGQMNLPQMLTHCTAQLRLALGELASAPQGSFMMRTAIGKWIAFSAIPWPKDSNTPHEMNVTKGSLATTDVESGKMELLRYLNKVAGATQLSPHPFFGILSRDEWGRLIYKHIDHHLKQFSQ